MLAGSFGDNKIRDSRHIIYLQARLSSMLSGLQSDKQ